MLNHRAALVVSSGDVTAGGEGRPTEWQPVITPPILLGRYLHSSRLVSNWHNISLAISCVNLAFYSGHCKEFPFSTSHQRC